MTLQKTLIFTTVLLLQSASNAINNVNPIIDAAGNTKLHLTTNPDEARALLKLGANVNGRNNEGCTFLTYAVTQHNPTLVQVALDYKADVNIQNNDGITPLMNAVNAQDLGVIKLLINYGADVTVKDNESQTAVDYAVNIVLVNPNLKTKTIKTLLENEWRKQHFKDEL